MSDKKSNLKIPFSMLMASSGHDMKNILASVIESVDFLFSSLTNLTQEQRNEFQKVNELLARVNSELMQILCIYKFENKQYAVNAVSQSIEDFLDFQLAFMQPLLQGHELTIDIECDENLMCSFDETLVSSAIRNAAMNALKFAKHKILLKAEEENGYLILSVEDDGSGYPSKMLGKVSERLSGVDFSTGSTGLGLFFSECVAKLHRINGLTGYLELSNDSTLGGGIFKLHLPKY